MESDDHCQRSNVVERLEEIIDHLSIFQDYAWIFGVMDALMQQDAFRTHIVWNILDLPAEVSLLQYCLRMKSDKSCQRSNGVDRRRTA